MTELDAVWFEYVSARSNYSNGKALELLSIALNYPDELNAALARDESKYVAYSILTMCVRKHPEIVTFAITDEIVKHLEMLLENYKLNNENKGHRSNV
jgi:hypothetical protein